MARPRRLVSRRPPANAGHRRARQAAGPWSSPAPCATTPTAKAAPKTPASPAALRLHRADAQRFQEWRAQERRPRKANTNRMAGFAKAMTEDEMKAAAQYFSSMKWTPWIKVVDTDMVPKTKINAGLYLALEGNEKEPIGQRIIEVPVNGEATETASRSAFRFHCLRPDRQHSRRARRWSLPAGTARRFSAAPAMARTCKASARCRELPAALRAIWLASSTTCRTASAPASGLT